ncbi:hypothetical protein NOM68_14405 [Proteus mirabilis]|uniref:hypothetical protein n=1 Tax=Proteus mirabilis TaxID=584 RepID=UPI00214F87D7|nr:hypothetical protein [Proteus mirabilis]MCS6722764.1 hypothetical protein [Proteus mirabilis]MCS6729767.1 hypothetical protein [Proteus mirabilis]MCS6741981.1 hypothetical protein [Acinetobacter baumannii]MCS6748731.1 hypothetical protein [Proteus mirabilis]
MENDFKKPEKRITDIIDNPDLIINQLFDSSDSLVFRDENTPAGCFTRKYKNGKVEHFKRDKNGQEILVNNP